jgi:hypothetical protein
MSGTAQLPPSLGGRGDAPGEGPADAARGPRGSASLRAVDAPLPTGPGRGLAGLRERTRGRRPQERCELCGAALPGRHRHLLALGKRDLVCACDACSILFSGQSEQRYRAVPDHVRYLDGFRLPDELWESLLIPVQMAFFFRDGGAGRVVAMYPSPAGATESLLELEAWGAIEAANPVLREMEPNVEALLVNRARGRRDHFLAPIDRCYELVGLLRAGWRGLSGGSEVWRAIDDLFADLRRGAVTVSCADG